MGRLRPGRTGNTRWRCDEHDSQRTLCAHAALCRRSGVRGAVPHLWVDVSAVEVVGLCAGAEVSLRCSWETLWHSTRTALSASSRGKIASQSVRYPNRLAEQSQIQPPSPTP